MQRPVPTCQNSDQLHEVDDDTEAVADGKDDYDEDEDARDEEVPEKML